jgi:hypothetical protein
MLTEYFVGQLLAGASRIELGAANVSIFFNLPSPEYRLYV